MIIIIININKKNTTLHLLKKQFPQHWPEKSFKL